MTQHSTTGPRRQPTWQKLTAYTVAAFLALLGFLAGRESAGADPGLHRAAATKPVVRTAAPAASTTTTTAPAAPASTEPDVNPPTTQAS